jgi:hypothetical protein
MFSSLTMKDFSITVDSSHLELCICKQTWPNGYKIFKKKNINRNLLLCQFSSVSPAATWKICN